jgi:hypothetical protein
MLRLIKMFYHDKYASKSQITIEKETSEEIFEKATQKAIAELQYKAIYKQMVMLAFDYNEEQFDIYQKYKDMYRFSKTETEYLHENKVQWTVKRHYHFEDYVIKEPTFEELIKALCKI